MNQISADQHQHCIGKGNDFRKLMVFSIDGVFSVFPELDEKKCHLLN